MRKVILYIAMSLDGYIADRKGKVAWLDEYSSDESSYGNFIKNVDTVIMGWKTYNQIIKELSPNNWVYKGLHTFVITHRKIRIKDEIKFVDEDPKDLINELKQEDGKDIWICGGASIVNQLLKDDLIDEFRISIVPTLLGDGVKLFEVLEKRKKLKLVKNKKYGDLVELTFRKEI